MGGWGGVGGRVHADGMSADFTHPTHPNSLFFLIYPFNSIPMNFASNMVERGRLDAARSPAVAQHGTAAYNAFQSGQFKTGIRYRDKK